MCLRFTIRDLLWLVVVAALVVGWWMDRRQANRDRLADQRQMEQLKDDFDGARATVNQLEAYIRKNSPDFRAEEPIDNMLIMPPPTKHKLPPSPQR